MDAPSSESGSGGSPVVSELRPTGSEFAGLERHCQCESFWQPLLRIYSSAGNARHPGT